MVHDGFTNKAVSGLLSAVYLMMNTLFVIKRHIISANGYVNGRVTWPIPLALKNSTNSAKRKKGSLEALGTREISVLEVPKSQRVSQ